MNVNQPGKSVPSTNRNLALSAGYTANPGELKDELVVDFGIAWQQVSAAAFVILVWSGFSVPLSGATVYHSEGSVASVQALHNAAHEGDTITLPAGTFSWTSRLNITKGITLQGATTITGAGTGSPTITDATIIKDDTPRSGGGVSGILRVEMHSGQSFRLTGFTFAPGSSTQMPPINGAIALLSRDSAPCTSMRIDHCHFASLYQGKDILISGWVYGVADHNVIECRARSLSFFVNHNTWGGASQINGNGSWADYPWYGTGKFWFIENNTIIGSGAGTGSGTIDTFNGGRWVARHNYWKNALPSGHGTEGGAPRGQRVSEFYNNIVNWTIPNGGGGQRSGTSMWHDNTYIGLEPKNGISHCNLANYRETPARAHPIWGMADGTSVWDQNDTEGNGTYVEGHAPHVFGSGTCTANGTITGEKGTVVDANANGGLGWTTNQWVGYSTKNTNRTSASYGLGSYVISNTSNTITYHYYPDPDTRAHLIFNAGDTYEIHRVLTMNDQNGRGKGDQVIGNPRPINTTTGRPGWTHQALEPCFSWNNICTPTNHVLGYHVRPGQPTTIAGIDYFNLGGGFPANTTPAAVSSRYTAALNGVAYTGTYTYPHPLVSGSPNRTPAPSPRPTSQHDLQKKEKKQKERKGGQKIGE